MLAAGGDVGGAAWEHEGIMKVKHRICPRCGDEVDLRRRLADDGWAVCYGCGLSWSVSGVGVSGWLVDSGKELREVKVPRGTYPVLNERMV